MTLIEQISILENNILHGLLEQGDGIGASTPRLRMVYPLGGDIRKMIENEIHPEKE